jgi:small multidrug resistance family-3 protein
VDKVIVWLLFVLAALFEVWGDATIRRGLRARSFVFVLLGCAVLGCYGLIVNTVRWDFSRLLGAYVGFFALISVLFGRIVLREQVPSSTWWGLALIVAGGLIIQFGRR